MNTTDLKAKAQVEIAKIEDIAVKEWLAAKAHAYSFKVVVIVAVVAAILGHII